MRALLQRLDSHEHLGQEVWIPNGRWRRRVVNPLIAIQRAGLRILIDDPASRLRIEAHESATVDHAAPYLALLVRRGGIEIGVREQRRRRPVQLSVNPFPFVDLIHEFNQGTGPAAETSVAKRTEPLHYRAGILLVNVRLIRFAGLDVEYPAEVEAGAHSSAPGHEPP